MKRNTDLNLYFRSIVLITNSDKLGAWQSIVGLDDFGEALSDSTKVLDLEKYPGELR